jgi:peptide chain release factor 2
MVKDLRTGVELGNVDAVLNGELEPLLEGWLRWRLGQETDTAAATAG